MHPRSGGRSSELLVCASSPGLCRSEMLTAPAPLPGFAGAAFSPWRALAHSVAVEAYPSPPPAFTLVLRLRPVLHPHRGGRLQDAQGDEPGSRPCDEVPTGGRLPSPAEGLGLHRCCAPPSLSGGFPPAPSLSRLAGCGRRFYLTGRGRGSAFAWLGGGGPHGYPGRFLATVESRGRSPISKAHWEQGL